jgi:hypothetical protein
MRIYTTTEHGRALQIVCESADTRNGFKHVCTIQSPNGYIYAKTKICYLNRTWERFTYESVIEKAFDLCTFCQDKKENAARVKRIKNRVCKALYLKW